LRRYKKNQHTKRLLLDDEAMRSIFFMMVMSFSSTIFAQANAVYTFGAYDDPFSKQATVLKLGPLPTSEIPSEFPRRFLEADGSYGGGEAFQSIADACRGLQEFAAVGRLPAGNHWHIYLTDAMWGSDTYELRPRDFRLSHTATVLQIVKEQC